MKGPASGDSWLEELDQSRPWTRQRFGPGDVEPKSMGPPLRRAGGASLPGPCRIFCYKTLFVSPGPVSLQWSSFGQDLKAWLAQYLGVRLRSFARTRRALSPAPPPTSSAICENERALLKHSGLFSELVRLRLSANFLRVEVRAR